MSYAKKPAGKKPTTQEQTWNSLQGIMRVYGNTFDGPKKGQKFVKWSATISGKDKDGEWINYYVPVKFRGEASEPETDGLHTLDVANAFFSCESYVNRNGDTVNSPVIVITDCEVQE